MLFKINPKPKFCNFRFPISFPRGNPLETIKHLSSHNSLDASILRISTAASLNYLMNPLVGFVDTFWVARLGDNLDIAGQGYMQHPMWMYNDNEWFDVREKSFNFGWENYP